jgi:hypothetical protein
MSGSGKSGITISGSALKRAPTSRTMVHTFLSIDLIELLDGRRRRVEPFGVDYVALLAVEGERRDKNTVVTFSPVLFEQFVEHVIEYKHAARNFKWKLHAEILLIVIDEIHHIKVIHTQ